MGDLRGFSLIEHINKFAEQHNINLSPELIAEIVKRADFRIIPKGESLAAIDDEALFGGLVLSGMIRAYYIDKNGNDITAGFTPPGFMCMDEGFFGWSKRLCMWETLDESAVLFCSTGMIRDLLGKNPAFKDLWILILENAYRSKIEREQSFLIESATERYLNYIELFPEIVEKVPQKHVATYLGITPESLSRIRRMIKDNPSACLSD